MLCPSDSFKHLHFSKILYNNFLTFFKLQTLDIHSYIIVIVKKKNFTDSNIIISTHVYYYNDQNKHKLRIRSKFSRHKIAPNVWCSIFYFYIYSRQVLDEFETKGFLFLELHFVHIIPLKTCFMKRAFCLSGAAKHQTVTDSEKSVILRLQQ